MSNEIYKTLLKDISEVLSKYDVEVLVNILKYIPKRKEAIKKYASEHKDEKRSDVWGYYKAMWNIAGGKGWYSLLTEYTMEDIINKVTKIEKEKCECRNAKFALKLEKENITSIKECTRAYTSDGWEGIWRVETDKGIRIITMSVIGAGGYNVQCFHYRTLLKIK